MNIRECLTGCGLLTLLCLHAGNVAAKVPADQAAKLDTDSTTCYGAERAASTDGIPAFSGKWLGAWPGAKPNGYDPGPYAGEKPLFTITADTASQYADKLTEGQKALFKKYPASFRMPVYPSHRDFRVPDLVCDYTKKNALNAELVHDGKGTTGIAGGLPYPIPQSGLEAIWNIIYAYRPWSEISTNSIADVYPNGSIGWGKQRYKVMAANHDIAKPGSYQDAVAAWFRVETLLPMRDKGNIAVGFQPYDFSAGSTHAWAYMPGTRRVRESPDVGFDYPVPPAGLHTTDEDSLFNGSPERYMWKLVGKKEIYVPYNAFRINDPSVKYSDLLKPGTINPDYERYELHRVWVVEATLKPGLRHIYSKRVMYADEDTWLGLWADNYDMRGLLWRVDFINYTYAPEAQAYHRGVTVYHDLDLGAYEAAYLVNEEGDNAWKLNTNELNASMFTPDSASRSGH